MLRSGPFMESDGVKKQGTSPKEIVGAPHKEEKWQKTIFACLRQAKGHIALGCTPYTLQFGEQQGARTLNLWCFNGQGYVVAKLFIPKTNLEGIRTRSV